MGYKKVGQVDVYKKTGGGCGLLMFILIVLFLLSQAK
jgi:hypothetical protein